LNILNLVKQRFVAEVPVNFMVRNTTRGAARRADERLNAAQAKAGRRYRLKHQTVKDSVWRAADALVWVEDHPQRLIVAINEATAEVKYFLTNATDAPVARVLAVAFRRWTVEHSFRLAKQEAGLMHYEGRDYLGLIRHLTMALVVLGFVATHTERLRGEKPARDRRTGMSGSQPTLRGDLSTPSRHTRDQAYQRSHSIPPAPKPAGDKVPQETAP
jgi:SRSO17 transposase